MHSASHQNNSCDTLLTHKEIIGHSESLHLSFDVDINITIAPKTVVKKFNLPTSYLTHCNFVDEKQNWLSKAGYLEELIDLVRVFDVILTSRQTPEKLQCLYGNLMSNNSIKRLFLKKIYEL